jgi:hypothetical protein
MNQSLKKYFGTGLVLALTAIAATSQTASFGRLPLRFEAGQGNQFIARGHDSEFFVTSTGTEIHLRQSDGQVAAARMQFIGANVAAKISAQSELPGKINRFVGNDPALWQVGSPTFAKVNVENVYSGINVVFYGSQQKLEYDFNLAAGVNPEIIAIRFDGAEKISLDPQGALVVKLDGGEMLQHPPVAYQVAGDSRHAVPAGYKIVDAHTVTFALGNFDRNLPLVIDPVLSYSTYFGGKASDLARAVAVDTNGFIYICGETLSTAFSNSIPLTTAGAFQQTFSGGAYVGDAFVAKLDNTGTSLIYLTYLGGSADDTALALAVNNAGNVFLTGFTDSANFPTYNPLFPQIAGPFVASRGAYLTDAFVTELNPTGSALVYSTYLGGNAVESGNAIAIDASGAAYVVGTTSSTNFPVTANARQKYLGCTNSFYYNANSFIVKIAPGGTNLSYSSFFGGTNFDLATGVALDAAKNIYVCGFTVSPNFPTTNYVAGLKFLNGSTTPRSASDAFVAEFKPDFAGLVYSTLLGGTNSDAANGIAVDAAGNACVVGWTTSTNFPNTASGVALNSFVATNITGFVLASNAFLTQVKWNGTSATLGFSRTFGGLGVDTANAVALDPAGNVFVAGSASSTNFPTTGDNLVGSLLTTNSGGSDVVVTVFAADFSGLLYSAYLGGRQNDFANGIAVDAAGDAYITGQTLSTNFPVFNARQPIRNGVNDAFLAKILLADAPALAVRSVGNKMLVTWPPYGQATPSFLGLETSTNPQTAHWIDYPQAPVLTNGKYTITFTPTNPARYFRLHKY